MLAQIHQVYNNFYKRTQDHTILFDDRHVAILLWSITDNLTSEEESQMQRVCGLYFVISIFVFQNHFMKAALP